MDEDHHFRLVRFEAILPTLATKADMEALRADIARWTLATVIGLFIGFSGLIMAMGNLFWKMPPQTVVQQAPPAQCQQEVLQPMPQEKSPR
ncbi:hypothetical protein GM658_13325 [Pseudoduganella eburnea]|uniref:Uncharacterized protein n=1 Tax=Massilia eburnea TaxID=1776165 RepID=A0A6L6QHH8_9BURK|nr:hypothetical protein [Massilia eburnea]MTW11580.1 hypothetical protein [Massilia eburnea]